MTLFLHLGMQDSCLRGDCEFLFVIKLTLAKRVSFGSLGLKGFYLGSFPPDIVKR